MVANFPVFAGLMGLCVGDALGVPVEFTSRAERLDDPVSEMRGYGTYNQPPGTWSDDSSLTFCLADALCDGFDLQAIADTFCQWFTHALWTPHGEVFDVGGATSRAIGNLMRGTPPLEAGGADERSNGNGSLMRTLPLAFYGDRRDFGELLDRVHQVSAITHAHPRSQMACGIYTSIVLEVLRGAELPVALAKGLARVAPFYDVSPFNEERSHFQRLGTELATLPPSEISSSGYVIHSLEAALWCALTSNSYAETVLKAVNLGSDTDTVAAIAGGLAGVYYGEDAIPEDWRAAIARKDDILDLARRLQSAIG